MDEYFSSRNERRENDAMYDEEENEWGNRWKSRPPTKTGVRLESRGGRGPAMMETQFGTKPAYAARELVLGWCWWVLVGIARGEGPGSCSGCAGRRGSRGWSLSSERSDPRKGAPQTVFAIRTPALARSDAMDCYRSARGCVVLGGKPLFSKVVATMGESLKRSWGISSSKLKSSRDRSGEGAGVIQIQR